MTQLLWTSTCGSQTGALRSDHSFAQTQKTTSVIHDTWLRGLTHTHTQPFYGPLGFSLGLPRWACNRKVKPIDLLEQEIESGSGIIWAMCKSAPWPRHITMPASHHSVFLQARCPSCRPANSMNALWCIYSAWKQAKCSLRIALILVLDLDKPRQPRK